MKREKRGDAVTEEGLRGRKGEMKRKERREETEEEK